MNNTKNGIVALLSLTIFSILALVIFILARCSEVINPIPVLTETSTGTTVSTTLETETTNSNTTISTTVLTKTETVSSSSNSTSSELTTTTETMVAYNTEPVTTKDEIISIPYDIIVVTDPPITTQNKVETTGTEIITDKTMSNLSKMDFVGTFQGTYYVCPDGTLGGSGRKLIDGKAGYCDVKGSISSRSLFNMFGYCNNGERTKVYIESESCGDLCGFYYLDDSTGECVLGVVDFFYTNELNSPFYGIGRLYYIKVYI